MGLNKKGGGGGFLFGPKEEGGGGFLFGSKKGGGVLVWPQRRRAGGGGGGFLFGPKQEGGRGRRRTPPTPLSALSGFRVLRVQGFTLGTAPDPVTVYIRGPTKRYI